MNLITRFYGIQYTRIYTQCNFYCLNLGCVKFRIKSWTKYQIKCLKMISKMTQKLLINNKSEQIINKICLFIIFKFKIKQLNIFFCVLFKKRIIFTLVIFCIHLKRFTLIQKHITLYMHRKTYATQNRLLFMCFKKLTFDRNNITLSYLSNHLKFCND